MISRYKKAYLKSIHEHRTDDFLNDLFGFMTSVVDYASVIGPEIMSPVGNTVCFVNDHQADTICDGLQNIFHKIVVSGSAPADHSVLITDEEPAKMAPVENDTVQHPLTREDLINEDSSLAPTQATDVGELSFYQFFLRKMACLDGPATADELSERWSTSKKQISEWLKQSVDEGRVQKLTNPVRFQSLARGKSEDILAANASQVAGGQMGFKLD